MRRTKVLMVVEVEADLSYAQCVALASDGWSNDNPSMVTAIRPANRLDVLVAAANSSGQPQGNVTLADGPYVWDADGYDRGEEEL